MRIIIRFVVTNDVAHLSQHLCCAFQTKHATTLIKGQRRTLHLPKPPKLVWMGTTLPMESEGVVGMHTYSVGTPNGVWESCCCPNIETSEKRV